MIYTHQTARTQFVEANGIRFGYRQFGKVGGVPIVFNQHYTGTVDYWDPAVTDGLARDREVILFNNAGVSSRFGQVPTTFEQMGANAIAFSRALGLNNVDVLGFSIGGMVAQEIALQAPDLVRKLQRELGLFSASRDRPRSMATSAVSGLPTRRSAAALHRCRVDRRHLRGGPHHIPHLPR